MISLAPTFLGINRLLGRKSADLMAAAADQWTICPPESRYVPPAVFLPHQLNRIAATMFGTVDEVRRHFVGGFESVQPATTGFRMTGVDLVDGVLYRGRSARHLRPQTRRRAGYRVPAQTTCGALYETWLGNRWFGNWLQDDCLTYRLAERMGQPVTTVTSPAGHVPDYEARLEMRPRRIVRAHFEELFVFRDTAQNAHRKARAEDFRRRTIGRAQPPAHPGVLLLRGVDGEPRRLLNEEALAEFLAVRRGFRVLKPSSANLDEIVEACGGAEVVVGVEGSHLVHGLMLMPPTGTLVIMQPPSRVASVLKMMTDLVGQTYAFVVGEVAGQGFRVELEEIERTIDLGLARTERAGLR